MRLPPLHKVLAEIERRKRLTEGQREEEQRLAVQPMIDERRELYEESLYEFLKAAWPYFDSSPWQDGWCIEAIAEHLQAVVDGQIRRLIINIPPRCCKSSLLAVAFPAWCWAQPSRSVTSGAGVRFLYASYAARLSLRDSLKCLRLLGSSWYQQLWGSRFGLLQEAAVRLVNDVGGERLVTSIPQGAATGEGADIFCIDDPNSANAADSEATIQATNDWWDQTASTRLNDPKRGAFIIQQQRLAEEDLTGHALEKNIGEWTHICLPMHYERERSFVTVLGRDENEEPITWTDPRQTEGELLWPARFGHEEVEILERTLGPWAAAGQLEQRPEPKGGGVIKRDWWNLWSADAFPPMSYVLASLDTAFTEKTENDPSAMTVWGVFTHNTQDQPSRRLDRAGAVIDLATYAEETPRVMLMTAWREWLELHDLVEKVVETCRLLKVDHILIEAKASGISVAQEIRRLYKHESFGVQLVDPKSMDKLARLHSVVPMFAPEYRKAQGKPVLDLGGKPIIARPGIVWAPERAWSDMVITEVGLFPKGKRKDLTDTTSQALRWLRDTGMLQLAPERLAEVEESRKFENVKRPAPLYPTA